LKSTHRTCTIFYDQTLVSSSNVPLFALHLTLYSHLLTRHSPLATRSPPPWCRVRLNRRIFFCPSSHDYWWFFLSPSSWFSLFLLSCHFGRTRCVNTVLPALVFASWVILLGKLGCTRLFLLKMMNLLKLKEGRKTEWDGFVSLAAVLVF